MHMRIGSSHVDEKSQRVYKIKLPYYTGGPRDLPPLTLLIDRKAARQIVHVLETQQQPERGKYIFDIRSRLIEVDRTRIRTEIEGNYNVDTNHHWYNGGDETKEYKEQLTDDWGWNSWQRLLVNLKCWIE